MTNELEKYLSLYFGLSLAQAAEIIAFFRPQALKKKRLLPPIRSLCR
ncbi:MAG: hypothetical protein HC880_11195 [Bacteroidia bacterium]|nr:hypothetical protein [Bacteroidia bacterium]